MTDDGLALITLKRPQRPLRKPGRPAGVAARVAEVVLLWRDKPPVWRVAAGDKWGELMGEPEGYWSRYDAERAAGRMAKRSGALALLVIDGASIEKYDYKP